MYHPSRKHEDDTAMLGTMLKALAGFGDRNAMLDTMLDELDREVFDLQGLVRPPADASPRHTFTSKVPPDQMSVGNMAVRERLSVGPTMLRLMREMKKGSRHYERRFEPTKGSATPEDFEAIERVATEGGATAVGYVTVPEGSIFADKAIPHRNAIVYTVAMSKEALDTAPSFTAFEEVAKAYLRLALIGNALTDELHARGHAGYPGTSLGGLTDYPRIAELAGLGTIGYHGLLISPQDGALLRLNTVYTSIDNLPAPASPPGWVRDFCSMCRKCIRSCPVDAIHPEPIPLDNGRVECIDAAVCLDYFTRNHGCAICADVCPFSQKGFDLLKAKFKGNPEAAKYEVR